MMEGKILRQYIFQREIGTGSFGSVFTAVDTNSDIKVAIKVFPKSNLEDSTDTERFQREINAMTFLRHDNLVSLNDFFWDDNNFYLVMDFCEGGELFDYIVDHEKLDENTSAFIFRQIVWAVAFCHSFGVAHRDLKPENILITKFPNVKVSDFGLCGFISEGHLMKTFCGSPCYCAPECLCRIQYDGRLSDVWSLGVILFAMVTGEHPWNISNTSVMLRQILKGAYIVPSYVSADCKDLITKMLRVSTQDRITIQGIADHPFLKRAEQTKPGFSNMEPLPMLQPVSLAEISEASARSSTRSDHGIFDPFSDIEDDISDSDDTLPPLIPVHPGRSASLARIVITKNDAVTRIAPKGIRIGALRQKSSSNLLGNIKKPKAPIIMSTIAEV